MEWMSIKKNKIDSNRNLWSIRYNRWRKIVIQTPLVHITKNWGKIPVKSCFAYKPQVSKNVPEYVLPVRFMNIGWKKSQSSFCTMGLHGFALKYYTHSEFEKQMIEWYSAKTNCLAEAFEVLETKVIVGNFIEEMPCVTKWLSKSRKKTKKKNIFFRQ